MQDMGYDQDQDFGYASLAGGTKRCNCKKARCLKLYCVCFAAGKGRGTLSQGVARTGLGWGFAEGPCLRPWRETATPCKPLIIHTRGLSRSSRLFPALLLPPPTPLTMPNP